MSVRQQTASLWSRHRRSPKSRIDQRVVRAFSTNQTLDPGESDALMPPCQPQGTLILLSDSVGHLIPAI